MSRRLGAAVAANVVIALSLAIVGAAPAQALPCSDAWDRTSTDATVTVRETSCREELLGLVRRARPGQVTPFLRAHAARFASRLAALGGDAESVEPGFLAAEQGFRELGTRSTSR